ncbi:eukaryotic-type carbonic anhydrase domain-containing protein [Ditylenchus destructor]|uniref:carbonic anhydrase n=1 Tax=Ditylenchus destructor TaxID=166010 RepID=A0AAD4QZP4_9BILA|nr:eukaryotic-type carbonic anhydrase domain-containing protein [Ditylenchus destructor]
MFFLFLILLIVASGSGDDSEFDYEYEGAHSMKFGGKIYQWLHRKDLGKETLYQSPIALRTNIDPEQLDGELHFVNYNENIFGKLVNNGHSVQFTATDDAKKKPNWPRIIFKAKEKNKPDEKPKEEEEPMLRYSSYRFEQYHIHWGGQDRDGVNKGGSEHRLCKTKANCTHYAAELHLVHVAEIEKDPTFVVVAILLEIKDDAKHNLSDDAESPLAKDADVLDHIVAYGTDWPLPSQTLASKLPEFATTNLDFITYKGSLTTPKFIKDKGLVCPQVVDWIVLTQPAYVTTKQLEKLRAVQNKKGKPVLRNWRPLQELNKRHPKRYVHPLSKLYQKCEPKKGGRFTSSILGKLILYLSPYLICLLRQMITFIKVNEIFCTIAGSALNVWLIRLIITCSDKDHSSSDWILLQNCVLEIAMLIISFIVQPGYSGERGFVAMLQEGVIDTHNGAINFTLLSISLVVSCWLVDSSAVQFVHRYLVLCRQQSVTFWKYALMLCCGGSFSVFFIMVYICFMIATPYSVIEPFYANMSEEMSTKRIALVYPMDSPYMTFLNWYTLFLVVIRYSVVLSTGAITWMYVRKELRNVSQRGTSRSRNLNFQVTMAITGQAITPLICNVIPSLFISYSAITGATFSFSSFLSIYSAVIMKWMPIMNAALTVLIIKKYRRAFFCCYRCRERKSVPVKSIMGRSSFSQYPKISHSTM